MLLIPVSKSKGIDRVLLERLPVRETGAMGVNNGGCQSIWLSYR